MKILRIVVIAAFFIILLLPMLFFNHTPNAVSLIDNRLLSENPFEIEGDFTKNVENYVNDRIGFRDEAISAYTVLNDKLFAKMVHPSYSYGKDGYVFGEGITTENSFGEYHVVFANMVKSIQDYCESRNVPFLFVFDPAKPAVYQDKIADGIYYNREWVELFFAELDAKGINYLDNTVTMQELAASGVAVFNKKYDANHWNDLGAFYGTNKMLEFLKTQCPSIHVNDLSEFSITEIHRDTFLVSNFPIDESVPSLDVKIPYSTVVTQYSDLYLHPSYRYFNYTVNETRKSEGGPKALVFQGSYMNSYGYKYLANAFGECICVHDYQNVIDFPYYFNIFRPQCVIFEVAEYTLSDAYFSYEMMKSIQYNPEISTLPEETVATIEATDEAVWVEKGETLSVIRWETDCSYQYVYIELDRVYDMKKIDEGYQIILETALVEENSDRMRIFVLGKK